MRPNVRIILLAFLAIILTITTSQAPFIHTHPTHSAINTNTWKTRIVVKDITIPGSNIDLKVSAPNLFEISYEAHHRGESGYFLDRIVTIHDVISAPSTLHTSDKSNAFSAASYLSEKSLIAYESNTGLTCDYYADDRTKPEGSEPSQFTYTDSEGRNSIPTVTFTPDGNPIIAYFQRDIEKKKDYLKYVSFNEGTWQVHKLESQGYIPHIAFDDKGHAVITYYHSFKRALMFTRFDGTQLTEPQIIDGKSERDEDFLVGVFNSVASDCHGNVGVAYQYVDATQVILKFARFDSTTGLWTKEVVDTENTPGDDCSLAYDHEGRPAICYWCEEGGDLKYAHFNGSAWIVEEVDTEEGLTGLYCELVFDRYGYPAIAYYDEDNRALKLAHKGSTDLPLPVGVSSSVSLIPTSPSRVAPENPKITADVICTYDWPHPPPRIRITASATNTDTGDNYGEWSEIIEFMGSEDLEGDSDEKRTVQFEINKTFDVGVPITVDWTATRLYCPERKEIDNITEDILTATAGTPSIDLVSTTPPLVNLNGPEFTAEVICSVQGSLNPPLSVEVKAVVTNTSNSEIKDTSTSTLVFKEAGTQTVTHSMDVTYFQGIPLKIEWTADYTVGQSAQTVTYTDYVTTASATTIPEPPDGYIILIDNIDDKPDGTNNSFTLDWEDSAAGKIKILIADYTAKRGSFELSFPKIPYVSDLNLGTAKGVLDSVVGVAGKAGWISEKARPVKAFNYVSPFIDTVSVTWNAYNCRIHGTNCPKDEWEAWDQSITWGLGVAFLGGSALVAAGIGGAVAPAVVAVAGTGALLYGSAKLIHAGVHWYFDDCEPGEVCNYYVQGQKSTMSYPEGDHMVNRNVELDVILQQSYLSGLITYLKQSDDEKIVKLYQIPVKMKDQTNAGIFLALVKNTQTGKEVWRAVLIEQPQTLIDPDKIIPPTTQEEPFQQKDYYVSVEVNRDLADPAGQYTMAKNTLFDPNSNTSISIEEIYGSEGGDLDLHIYAGDGHLGMNYDTGKVENTIPGAWYTGDVDTGVWKEMIVLPADITDYKVVVDAEGAKHKEEQYEISVRAIRNSYVHDRRADSKRIKRGKKHEFKVKVEEIDGETRFDTEIGKKVTVRKKSWLLRWPAMPLLYIAIFYLWMRHRRKKRLKKASSKTKPASKRSPTTKAKSTKSSKAGPHKSSTSSQSKSKSSKGTSKKDANPESKSKPSAKRSPPAKTKKDTRGKKT